MVLTRFKLSAAFIITALLCGCATTGGDESSVVTQQPVIGKQLGPQNLPAGECALFVWSADAKKQFILFSQSKPKTAIWYNGQQDVALSVTQTSGSEAYGQYPVQSLSTPNGEHLELKLSDVEGIETGTRYKSGLLSITQKGDWERIVPVVGLATCQS